MALLGKHTNIQAWLERVEHAGGVFVKPKYDFSRFTEEERKTFGNLLEKIDVLQDA